MYVVLKSKLNGKYLTQIDDCHSRLVFQATKLKYSRLNDVFQMYRTANDQISFALMKKIKYNNNPKNDLMLAINQISGLVTSVTKEYLNSHPNMQQIVLFSLAKNTDLTFSIMSNENRKFVGSLDMNRFPLEALFANKGQRVRFFIELVNKYHSNEKGLNLK